MLQVAITIKYDYYSINKYSTVQLDWQGKPTVFFVALLGLGLFLSLCNIIIN